MTTPAYKQHPTWSALIGAVACLIMALLCFFMIYQRVQSGEIGEEKLLALIVISITVSGILFIVAFARYQFTHLWMGSHKRALGYRHKNSRSSKRTASRH
jgi:drug/metabolite transporter (DMT)-like permease